MSNRTIKVNYALTTGKILGYYPSDINYTNIPSPTIEIDSVTHQNCISNHGDIRVDLVTHKIVLYDTFIIELSEAKSKKFTEIDAWTKARIVGGFVSSASGANVTYDSDEDTQSTMQTMYVATKSSDFANHPDYQGVIPVRGFSEGSTVKAVFYLTAVQVQKFMDDLALHIGKCKQEGWAKQALVENASTVEELEQIVL